MMILLTSLLWSYLIVLPAYGSFEDEFIQIVCSDSCYYYSTKKYSDWADASRSCSEYGMKLASILNIDTQDVLKAAVSVFGPAWIGGHEILLNEWQCMNGKSCMKQFNPPTEAGRSGQAMYLSFDGRNIIAHNDGYSRKFNFICERDNGSKYISPREQYCDPGNNELNHNWFEARRLCEEAGARLLQLNDLSLELKSEMSQILCTNQNYWVGVRNSKWIWENGDEVIYSNWDDSQPAYSPGEFYMVISQVPKGKWDNRKSGVAEYNYICEAPNRGMPEKSPVPLSTTDSITTEEDNEIQPWTIAIIAVGIATAVIILITIILVVVIRKRKRREPKTKETRTANVQTPSHGDIGNENFQSVVTPCHYSTGTSVSGTSLNNNDKGYDSLDHLYNYVGVPLNGSELDNKGYENPVHLHNDVGVPLNGSEPEIKSYENPDHLHNNVGVQWNGTELGDKGYKSLDHLHIDVGVQWNGTELENKGYESLDHFHNGEYENNYMQMDM